MTIPDWLLPMLVCPIDKRQGLRPVDAEALARINERIVAGKVVNRAGKVVGSPLEAALLREDGAVVYRILKGIPVLLQEEAIVLENG